MTLFFRRSLQSSGPPKLLFPAPIYPYRRLLPTAVPSRDNARKGCAVALFPKRHDPNSSVPFFNPHFLSRDFYGRFHCLLVNLFISFPRRLGFFSPLVSPLSWSYCPALAALFFLLTPLGPFEVLRWKRCSKSPLFGDLSSAPAVLSWIFHSERVISSVGREWFSLAFRPTQACRFSRVSWRRASTPIFLTLP